MYRIIAIILCFTFLTSVTAQYKNKDYYLDISKALGYSYGVEWTITQIQEKYPKLIQKALISQVNFNLAHGKAIENMEDQMSELMKIGKAEFKDQMVSKIAEKFDISTITYKGALDYLNSFEDDLIYGRHEIYNEFVQILLRHNLKYQKLPVKEFLDNYRTIYKSFNHDKSKGLNISIEYPTSWVAREGKRPNILQFVESYEGECNFTIQIRDLLLESNIDIANLSDEELEYISSGAFEDDLESEFNYDYGRSFIEGIGLENLGDYKFDKIIIDGQPGIRARASGDLKRGVVDMRVITIMYFVLYKHYIINLGFMITNDERKLSIEKEKYEILCELIASSLIIIDKW